MKPNKYCYNEIEHNISLKVMYDIQMLSDDTVQKMIKVLKLFDDVYSINDINDNLYQHQLESIWYKVPNLSKFKYKFGIHKNKIREMIEVKDIFVKVLTKNGKIYVNFAYAIMDIVKNNKVKLTKKFYKNSGTCI